MSLRKELEQEIAIAREVAYRHTADLNRIIDMYEEKQEADLAYVAMMSGVDMDDEEEDGGENE